MCNYCTSDKVGEKRGQALEKHSGQAQSYSASTNIPLPYSESFMLVPKIEQISQYLSSCIQSFPGNVRYEQKSGAQSIDHGTTALDFSAVQFGVLF